MAPPPLRRMWSVAAIVVLAVATILMAHPASAHALLVSSNPKGGQTLATGPGIVVLEFDDALNRRLSTATVTDPTGRVWRGSASGSMEMRVPVQTNAQGVYTVDWTTVSIDDGHHITGSFSFGVGINPTTRAAPVQTEPRTSDVLLGIGRWAEALALLALVGQLAVRRLARRPPRLPWVRAHLILAPVALAFGLIVVVSDALIAAGLSGSGLATFFASAPSGPARLATIAFEVVATLAAVRGWRTIWLWTGGAIASVAASGHAAAVTPAWWGISVDTVHLASAGVWAGGIGALAVQRPPGGWHSPEARRLLERFSPMALAAFAVTIAAGGLEAALQLGSLAALTGSAYGRVLLAKVTLVALMLPLSLVAWRRRRPRPRAESAIAACVVAAAALLASFPAPPTEAAQAAARQATALPSPGLPGQGDLTLAAAAGSVLVGVSLEPGRPGPNRVLVYLDPLSGTTAAGALEATATVAGVTHQLQRCGATCRDVTIAFGGGETLDVDVLGHGGGRASFTVPALPAPGGAAELARMQARMHRLSSYRVAESLSSGTSVISSVYASVAPDRSVWTTNGLTDEISIGTSQWTRQQASQPWQVATGLQRNRVPSFVWDYFAPLKDAHIVGRDTMDGAPMTVLATFGLRQGTAVWFRYWVDPSGLVHQVDMDAVGHFMVDRYLSYDTPISIQPPT